jgi:hypothetical protein
MLRLKTFLRVIIVAHFLVVSLVFSTLHPHFIGYHDHESDEIHRHGMVHAHFLVSLASGDSRTFAIHHHNYDCMSWKSQQQFACELGGMS